MKRNLALYTLLALVVGLCSCTAARSAPNEDAPQGLTWQEQYDLGMRYLTEGNYAEAIIAFTAAIEIDPKQPLAYVGRGDAYVLSGETDENLTAAKADYETAIELDETVAEAYLGLADVYIRQGDYEKALKILREALEKTGENPTIAGKIAELELNSEMAGDEDDILVRLRRAEEGEVITLQQDIAEEQTDRIDIYGGSPTNPIVLDLNGHTLFIKGEWEGANYDLNIYGTLQIRDSGNDGGALKLSAPHRIYVQPSGYLLLDGGAIDISNGDRDVSTGSSAMIAEGTAIMNDGTIFGTVVAVNSGSLTMNGGSIICGIENLAGKESVGSAVQTDDNSTFIMNNGTISGVVRVGDSSAFIMNNGTITSEEIFISSNAALTQSGGGITSEDVSIFDDGAFNRNGGTFSGKVNSYGN